MKYFSVSQIAWQFARFTGTAWLKSLDIQATRRELEAYKQDYFIEKGYYYCPDGVTTHPECNVRSMGDNGANWKMYAIDFEGNVFEGVNPSPIEDENERYFIAVLAEFISFQDNL